MIIGQLDCWVSRVTLFLSVCTLLQMYVFQKNQIKLSLRQERKKLINKIYDYVADLRRESVWGYVHNRIKQTNLPPIDNIQIEVKRLELEAKYLLKNNDYENFEKNIVQPILNFIELAKITDCPAKWQNILEEKKIYEVIDNMPKILDILEEKYLNCHKIFSL